MQLLYLMHSIINHNFDNNYEHWQCMYFISLAYDKNIVLINCLINYAR